MTALSITLSNRLATESKEMAARMGISRSEFIRMAVKHEVERFERELKLQSLAKSFTAMRNSKRYRAESTALDEGFDEGISGDQDDWWK